MSSIQSGRPRCQLLALAVYLILLSGACPASQEQNALRAGAEDTPDLNRIRTKLADPITLEFVATPLGDVVDFLKDYTQVNVLVDRQALESEGVTLDTPVTVHVRNISLQSALSLVLEPLHLAWVLKDDCLVITSRDVADRHLLVRSYRVGDLAASGKEGEQLAELTGRVIDPARYPHISYVEPAGVMFVRGNVSVHRRVQRLLDGLRGVAVAPAWLRAMKEKMAGPVSLEFVETPLGDVVDFLRDYTELNIVYDTAALDEEGITRDVPISVNVQSIALEPALTVLLRSLSLTYAFEHECLVITSEAAARARLDVGVFLVGDRLGEQANLGRDAWLRMARAMLPEGWPESVAAKPGRVFAPGTSVNVRWSGAEFRGTVAEVHEGQYGVRFPLGGTERTEWVNAADVWELREGARESLVDYFEPRKALVVVGPDSLRREAANLVQLLGRSGEDAGK